MQPEPTILAFTAEPTWGNVEAAAEGKPAKLPTFSMVAYTGGPMRPVGFTHPVIVAMDGIKSEQSIPIRMNHSGEQGVGHTTGVTVKDGKLVAEGVISRDTPFARELVASGKNGFPWKASIGASIVDGSREFLVEGKSAVVNGQTVNGPIHIIRASRLNEISFVDIPADPGTSAAIAAQKNKENATMADQNTATKTEEQKNGSEQAAGTTTVNASADPFADVRKERNRKNKITELALAAARENIDIVDEIATLREKAIEAGASVEQFELQMLRLQRTPNASETRNQRKAPEHSAELIEAAICRTGGLTDIEKHFDEKVLDASAKTYRSGLGLVELLLVCARRNGYHGHSTKDVQSILRAAFAGEDIHASGGPSTFSLSGILSNVANKFLAQGFNSVDRSWSEIAARRNVRDFKQVTSYSLNGDFTYDEIAPGGELKHATVGETTYTNQAKTYGKMFGIDRRDIINDDLGALTRVPFRIGRGGALKLNDVFWTVFMNNSAFFTTGNKNYFTGGTTNLQASSLKTAEKMFLDQTDPNGKPIALLPEILLLPNDLKRDGMELMQSSNFNTGGSSSTTQVPNANTWQGAYRVVTSPYLNKSAYTGYSTTAWYLLANPLTAAVIEVAFLNGVEEPTVESANADFNTLGIQMRGYHDFGVALQEYRAGVKSKGAA